MPNQANLPNRRSFLYAGAVAIGGTTLARSLASWGSPRGVDIRIEVIPAEPIGPVTPRHYGHFVEHLGGVIYDGVWVGERSSIPNYRGIRKALVDDLAALTPGVVRWPGGCFADSYDWEDGIGPRNKRPRRTNFWASELPASVTGPSRYDPNHFGTPEFLRFCKLVGAEPYLAVNGRSLDTKSFARWVEYCNSPAGSTTMAEKRAADGSVEPHNVRYWGLGNEPWFCGGQLSPEEYSEEYRRMAAWVPVFPTEKGTVQPLLIAAGPLQEPGDDEWTSRFIDSMKRSGRKTPMPYGYSLHSYFWRRDGLDFTPTGWYELLKKPRGVASLLERQAAILRTAPTPITMVLDEWGAWYEGATGQTDPSHIFEQTPTVRDAVVTAMLFDVFHAHVDVLGMTTVAQTVNCIHSLFITKGARCVRTPVYHAFALYQPHIGGVAVRTEATADPITFPSGPDGSPDSVDGVSASATLHAPAAGRSGKVVVTVTNPKIDEPATATIRIRGVKIKSGEVAILTHSSPHARNTPEQPDMVESASTRPLELAGATATDSFTLTLPAASVSRVICSLA